MVSANVIRAQIAGETDNAVYPEKLKALSLRETEKVGCDI
jgi:hypothetical protein